jgi:hypothetical protein
MIRRGSLQDISLLQQLGKETFAHTFGNTCTKEDMRGVLETYFNTEQVRAELSDDSDHFFFHETQGIAQGYMRINAKHACPIESIQDLRCIELVRLYVLADYHGKGVANALMDYAFDFARTNGYQVMYLSVWEYNFRARGFYEKYGFINSGIENDFPLGSTPQTDYWFVKRL